MNVFNEVGMDVRFESLGYNLSKSLAMRVYRRVTI